MRTDDPAAFGRNGGHCGFEFAVERIKFGEISGCIRFIVGPARRVSRDERVPDIVDIDLAMLGGLPGMRVRMTVGQFTRCDPGSRLDNLGLGSRSSHQTAHPAFEAKPIGNDDLRIRDLPGVRPRRRIDVGVTVGADEGCDIHAVAADGYYKIPKDRECRQHFEAVLRLRRMGTYDRERNKRGCDPEHLSSYQHRPTLPDDDAAWPDGLFHQPGRTRPTTRRESPQPE